MASQTGQKTGGRKKGTPNKVKKSDLREFIDENVSKYGYIEKLFSDIEEIEDPDKRARRRMEVLEFVIGKIRSVDQNISINEESGKIEIIYKVSGPKEKDSN